MTQMSELQLTTDPLALRPASARDYFDLLKPRIIFLVVFTGLAGLVAAQGVTGISMDPVLAAISVLTLGSNRRQFTEGGRLQSQTKH